jgi:AcrR family transcriptional regulator
MPDSGGPRVENEQRRSEILHLAAIEFSRRGFHATTVRDLARAVELTQPMLYYYVGSKETFLLSICEELLDAHVDAVSHLESSPRPSDERLVEFFDIELTLSEKHRPEVMVYLRERQTLPPQAKKVLRTRQDALERVLRTILTDGLERHELDIPSVESTAAAIWAILNASSASITTGHVDYDAHVQARELSTLILRGILPRG